MEYNNDTVKKLYYGDSLVNMAVTTGGGSSDLPANLSSWTYDDYGRPSSIVIKNGVTNIPSDYQRRNPRLSSVTIPNTVTTIGNYSFAYVGSEVGGLNLDNIDLSGVIPTNSYHSIFQGSYIKGNITIPNNSLSGATSGTSCPCYQMFDGCIVPENAELTINVYADNRIISRDMFRFSNASTVNRGKIDIIIHGTPTFLSQQSFLLISGNGIASQSVTFADCTTPPDAPSYTTGITFPFRSFNGTIYVPSAGLDAWQTKYSEIADKIKAIGT